MGRGQLQCAKTYTSRRGRNLRALETGQEGRDEIVVGDEHRVGPVGAIQEKLGDPLASDRLRRGAPTGDPWRSLAFARYSWVRSRFGAWGEITAMRRPFSSRRSHARSISALKSRLSSAACGNGAQIATRASPGACKAGKVGRRRVHDEEPRGRAVLHGVAQRLVFGVVGGRRRPREGSPRGDSRSRRSMRSKIVPRKPVHSSEPGCSLVTRNCGL